MCELDIIYGRPVWDGRMVYVSESGVRVLF